MSKYGKEGAFDDPIVRCCECSRILLVTKVKELGMCSKCGNRKVRNVLVISEEEMTQWRHRLPGDFLALFEEKGGDDDD